MLTTIDLSSLRKLADKSLSEFSLACKQVKQEKLSLQEAKETVSATEQSQIIIQEVAQEVQQSCHKQIAEVVTRCLEAVFPDDPYQFVIHFHQKRGRTEAELVLVRDGQEMNPLKATGGGVVDLVSFALRLSCLVLSHPRKRKLLVLDEPFSMVSKEYRQGIRQLIEQLSTDLGVQIIMVTHSQEFRIGNVVEVQ